MEQAILDEAVRRGTADVIELADAVAHITRAPLNKIDRAIRRMIQVGLLTQDATYRVYSPSLRAESTPSGPLSGI